MTSRSRSSSSQRLAGPPRPRAGRASPPLAPADSKRSGDCRSGGRRSCAERLDPVSQRAPGDPQVLGDAPERDTWGGLVQINVLPTKTAILVPPGHRRIFSFPPARMLDSACPRSGVRAQGTSRPHMSRVELEDSWWPAACGRATRRGGANGLDPVPDPDRPGPRRSQARVVAAATIS